MNNMVLMKALAIAKDALEGATSLAKESPDLDSQGIAEQAVQIAGQTAMQETSDPTQQQEAELATIGAMGLLGLIFKLKQHHAAKAKQHAGEEQPDPRAGLPVGS